MSENKKFIYINMLEVTKFPEKIHAIKILSDMSYNELNNLISTTPYTYYFFHEKILYFIGYKNNVIDLLNKGDVIFEELEDIPAVDIINRKFNIFRVIFYKSFRSYLISRGFTWDYRRKNVAFVSKPNPKLKKEISNAFDIKLINTFFSRDSSILLIHEGFRYKLDLVEGKLMLTIFPRVTPLVKTKDYSDIINNDIVFVCRRACPWITMKLCRFLGKKIRVEKIKYLSRDYLYCPEYVEDRKVLQIIDVKGRTYEIPRHVIFLEARPSTIRRLGIDVYRAFRKLALKNTQQRLNALNALLYYLSNGGNCINIRVGDDNEAISISAKILSLPLIERDDVWKKYALEG